MEIDVLILHPDRGYVSEDDVPTVKAKTGRSFIITYVDYELLYAS